MPDIAISVENLSKRYRLGQIGATSLRDSAQRLWHRLRGRDPDEEMSQVVLLRSEMNRKGERPLTEYAESAEWKDLWALKDVSFEVERRNY